MNQAEALKTARRLLEAVAAEMDEADFDPTDTDTIYGQILEFLDTPIGEPS